ncbi:MAG TPA: FkbM family methyltransferase [Terracidiphilus sp.]|nr:FkbM family methyltransferase [Terracidiphilus sp.]
MRRGTAFLPKLLLKSALGIERMAAYAQGKGYGTSSIRQENALVHKLLNRQPQLVIDIGGNIGDYTAELRRRNPLAEVHTFEPSPTNVGRLRSRFKDDKNIFIVPFAVSDTVGAATLYSDDPGSGLASLTQRKLDHFGIHLNVKESIDTIRFEDYWLKALNGRPLDIVKIDIEGHELAALKGFGNAISSTSVFQFEFGGCNIDTRTFFQDFWYFFKEHEFEIFRITPLGLDQITRYRELDEFFSTTNLIAAKRD